MNMDIIVLDETKGKSMIGSFLKTLAHADKDELLIYFDDIKTLNTFLKYKED